MAMTERGVDAGALEALLARVRREVDEGPLPSCQIALAKDGQLVAFEAFGDATTSTRYNVFSCTKPFVAAVLWQLIGEGEVDVSGRVAELIPEFGTNGKDVVTIEQVMLHTGGFPHATLGPPTWETRDGRLAAFERWRLNWEPGTAYEYHATSAHWVLAEIIDRVTGRDYRDVVAEQVTGPMGLPRVLGIPVDDTDGIAELAECGTEATPDELEAVLGVRELPMGEVTNEALLGFNRPEVRAVGVPGGGGVMTAATLALFYQHLLHDPNGLWDPAVRTDAMGVVRNRLPDLVMGTPANRTLGLVQAGDDGLASFRGFGKTTSPATVGHAGAAGQIGWVDPVSGLSVGFATNGIDRHLINQFRRGVAISSRAGVCAGPTAAT